MGSSGARSIQLVLFILIGVGALVAVFLISNGGIGGVGDLGLFGPGQSRQTEAGGPGAPRQADSVAAFTKKHGDPPDATYGRIRIPSISVDAPLSYRRVTGSVMPDPSGPTDVAYYDLAKFPGMGGVPGGGGNAIFGGHVDLLREIEYAGNATYSGPAVFWSLDELGAGDTIEIDVKGATYKYRVTKVSDFDADKADWSEVWSSDVKKDTITLFTCGGAFDQTTHEYSHRRIVRAERA